MATGKRAASSQKLTKVVGRQELIRSVAAQTRISQKEASLVVEATLDAIMESLAEGKEVRLVGFGSFKVRSSAARKGVNPRTGEIMEIAAKDRVRFSPGQELSGGDSGGYIDEESADEELAIESPDIASSTAEFGYAGPPGIPDDIPSKPHPKPPSK
jgi:DNA-binding protein HU-beta